MDLLPDLTVLSAAVMGMFTLYHFILKYGPSLDLTGLSAEIWLRLWGDFELGALSTLRTVKTMGIHGDELKAFCITKGTRAGQGQNTIIQIQKGTHRHRCQRLGHYFEDGRNFRTCEWKRQVMG